MKRARVKNARAARVVAAEEAMVVEVGAADTAEEAEEAEATGVIAAIGVATGVVVVAGIAIAAATVTEFILFGYAKARRLSRGPRRRPHNSSRPCGI